MKKLTSLFLIFSLVFAASFHLVSCEEPCEHIDEDFDGECDECDEDTDVSTSLVNVNGKYAVMKVKKCGTIIIKLDRNAAPETVERFATLANSGFYDGLTFHRVISDFMIQGGDPNGNGTGGYIVDGVKQTIKGEFSKNGHKNDLKFARGVLGMARGEDYNSASSQFFICNSDSSKVSNLNGSYAAFGRVIEGIEVVDAITSATAGHATDINGSIHEDDQAVIKFIRIVSKVEIKT